MKRSLTAALSLLALAACDSGTGSTELTSVDITPANANVAVGGTVQLTANTTDASGKVKSNVSASWQSLTPATATVNGSGLVSGLASGLAKIVATVRDKADTVTVSVGTQQLVEVNTNADEGCTNPQLTTARIAATSQHAIILADVTNPDGGFTDSEYTEIAQTFDNLIWPSDTENFGTPPDIDGNGKVYILFTRAVNAMTPPNANYVVGGFFYARDLFPRVATVDLPACRASNEREIFYMLAADPNGAVNGNQRSKSYVRNSSLATVAHEFQHLINSGRRLIVNKLGVGNMETVWLDEGLSHVAEELAFYRATGLGTNQNLTNQQAGLQSANAQLFTQYQVQNTLRYETYLQDPERQSPIDPNDGDSDDLETRGAIWSFLRYAADRKGGTQQQTWFNLVNSSTSGIANLNNVFGSALPLIRDWSVSVYTDDAVATEARFTQPSWNTRNIQAGINNGVFPLKTQPLANGTTSPFLVKAGSAPFARFGVAAGARAELRTTSGGGTVAGTCSTGLSLSVGQVVTISGDQGGLICIDGGAAGSEYVYIPFFSAAAGSLAVEVTPTNIVAASGPPNPNRLAFASDLGQTFRTDAFTKASGGDGGFHLRLRRRERAELASLAGGRSAPRRAVDAAQAPATLQISIVRTK